VVASPLTLLFASRENVVFNSVSNALYYSICSNSHNINVGKGYKLFRYLYKSLAKSLTLIEAYLRSKADLEHL